MQTLGSLGKRWQSAGFAVPLKIGPWMARKGAAWRVIAVLGLGLVMVMASQTTASAQAIYYDVHGYTGVVNPPSANVTCLYGSGGYSVTANRLLASTARGGWQNYTQKVWLRNTLFKWTAGGWSLVSQNPWQSRTATYQYDAQFSPEWWYVNPGTYMVWQELSWSYNGTYLGKYNIMYDLYSYQTGYRAYSSGAPGSPGSCTLF